MGTALSASTRDIWNHVISLPVGSTFTGPDFREKFCRKIPYKTVYARLHYLSTLKVLEKTNTWTGDNQIVYKVVDVSKTPRAIDLSKLMNGTRKGHHTGKGLYKGVKARIDSATIERPFIPRPQNVVDGVNLVADILKEVLELSKKPPELAIKNFSTAELFAELESRTKPTQAS